MRNMSYKTYTEFQEVDTMVEDTFFQEYEAKIREEAAKARAEAEAEAAKAAKAAAKAAKTAAAKAAKAAAAEAAKAAKAAAKTAAAERSRDMAQYLIGKKWDAREIAEATKLDMDTVQSLFAQG
jgi:hypothetical protein